MEEPRCPQSQSAEPDRTLMTGFRYERVKTEGAEINVAIGGNGPPLLLLHGNPLTHVSWHRVAPQLAERFTVVAPDLRGYGDSSKPDGGEDHAAYTFRAMGEGQCRGDVAFRLRRFQVAGHDRGARVAFRMALDFPERIERLAALDIVPTYHVLTQRHAWAGGWRAYHWFFMAQKAPFPGRADRRRPRLLHRLQAQQEGRRAVDLQPPRRWPNTSAAPPPEQIHAVCEDYRATVTLDYAMDSADFGVKRDRLPGAGAMGLQQPLRPALQAAGGLEHRGRRTFAVGRSRPATIRPRSGPTSSRRVREFFNGRRAKAAAA